MAQDAAVMDEAGLDLFACPNPDCDLYNHFGAGNLSVAEHMGKSKSIRRFYCNHCQHRFSERAGSLMQFTKLPQQTVVRIVKCLTWGCSVEATADICQVDARSVQRLQDCGGRRAEDFHQRQLDRLGQLDRPPLTVEFDELHARVAAQGSGKKGGLHPVTALKPAGAVQQAATGFMRQLKQPAGLTW
jgi:transposase-like protein